MWEFNIQPVAGGCFNYPKGIGCEIFQPNEIPSSVIADRDVCFIHIEGCEVSFSDEMHRVHVVFESGDIAYDCAFQIVVRIAAKLTIITGETTIVHEC